MASTAAPVILKIAGRKVLFKGDAQDDYFKGLAAFRAGVGKFERYVKNNLRPDSVCFDVGANIGLTAILLSLYCPDGQVYAFEASPTNARFLRENLELNGISNCVVVESAVGSCDGTLEFHESIFGAGSHVVAGGGQGNPRVVVVPVTTLDTFVQSPSFQGNRVDFMKIDVEGYEPAVLAGGAQLIERDRPAVFMEFNAWCLQVLQGYNHAAFARVLAEAFELSTIDEGGDLTPLSPGEVYGFLHRNIFQHGCIDDVLLRLRAGTAVPSMAEMTKSSEDLRNLDELHRLRSELVALRKQLQAAEHASA